MDGTRGIIAHQVMIKNLIVDFYSELKKKISGVPNMLNKKN